MLHLLFAVIFLEAAVILSLLFKTPARKFVIAILDRLKCCQGPIIVKTVSATIFAVFVSRVYSAVNIQKRWIRDGDVNPTDQVLMSKHILEASLIGLILFLSLLVDRLHQYIRELRIRRKNMEAVEKKREKLVGPEDLKAREEQVGTFRDIVRHLQSDNESKAKEVASAESDIEALRRQCEGLLVEYDRLLAENQELRAQLESLNQRL